MMREIAATKAQIAGLRRALAEQEQAQRIAGAYLTALCHGADVEGAAQLLEVRDDVVIVSLPDPPA